MATPRELPDLGEVVNDDNAEAGTFDELVEGEFTDFAWAIIQVARRLGQGQKRPEVTSVRRLLAAIMLSANESQEHTGTWLALLTGQDDREIRKRLGSIYSEIRLKQGSFDRLLSDQESVSTTMSANLDEVLKLARRLARESQSRVSDALIGARHLLGAAVRRKEGNTIERRFLNSFGLDADVVRNSMISRLKSWDVADDPDVWLRILDPVPDAVAEQTVPTYSSDAAVGPDWIGITREVEAMASLVSAWSVEPPLSIGLFGEWGSGKSFFMQKMKERVRQISREARKSGVGQKEFGYYKNIVQVEFNAWHYVEGNLWASLVEHIFANLKLEAADGEDVDSEANIAERLKRLLSQVREKSADADKLDADAKAATEAAIEEKQTAEKRAKELEEQADESTKRAEIAEEQRDDAQKSAEKAQSEAQAKAEDRRKIELTDIIEDITDSDVLRGEVRTALSTLGITDARLETVDQMRGALREATDTGTLIANGVGILKADKQRWRLLAWVFVVPAAVAAVSFFVQRLTGQQDAQWLQSVLAAVSAISAIPTFIVAAWKKYGPKLKPVLETIEKLKEKRAQLETRVEAARKIRSEKAVALDKEAETKNREADEHRERAKAFSAQAEDARRSAATKQVAAVEMVSKAADARREAEKLALDADLLRPERRIATFIQDRAAAQDYRRFLGVPATIRRDFEKLAAMFRTQRHTESNNLDGCDDNGNPLNNRNNPAVVNRIILYIDDLDRCPPNKVVEVLQAIHLLLAFPLFVVIVAVDARWMKRSLRNQFALMLSGPDGSSEDTSSDTLRKKTPDETTATPDDYLEKIFQVPFWIRSLGTSATQNLVRELTRNDLRETNDPKNLSKQVAANKSNDATSNQQHTEAQRVSSAASPSGQATNVYTESQTSGQSTRDTNAPPPAAFDWSPIEAKPRTLFLSGEERDYMISLASVVGRSPRAVKRFVNCYRLAKMTLDDARVARYERDGTFKITMLLLGVVSGMSEIAPALLSDLRKADKNKSPTAWAKEVSTTVPPSEKERWNELQPIIAKLETSGVQSIQPLVTAADHVDRFSFNPVRSIARP